MKVSQSQTFLCLYLRDNRWPVTVAALLYTFGKWRDKWNIFGINILYFLRLGPGVAQWLRRCATSRTVPGSIAGGVTGFLSYIFPSDRTMALGSTQPLVKMSTRSIPGGKGGRRVRVTTSPPLRAECHEIWEPKPPGTLWDNRACYGTALSFTSVVSK
jgi:hypothetical protein